MQARTQNLTNSKDFTSLPICRKDVELEQLDRPASLEFPLIEDLDNYEERVIYYNNQRISILRQKSSEGQEEANPD